MVFISLFSCAQLCPVFAKNGKPRSEVQQAGIPRLNPLQSPTVFKNPNSTHCFSSSCINYIFFILNN
ncbi:hypothetical protein L2E82_03989 [Cichorium intybus]|uniref:Uncharacterized protein n=1 Tax=Cichorium intybus TaxID=13427 RepID=A0ACB9H6D0_CICIN|nr:hypothetical protein L2E82_03989 [Cichorium intybus]